MGVFAEKEILANFRTNLWAGRLFRSFAKHPLETYQEAYDRALEQVEIEEQLQIKMDHDKARFAKRPKKENQKPAPTKKVQNLPLNRSTYKPSHFSQHQGKYPSRRSPPRRTPPRKEIARITDRAKYVVYLGPQTDTRCSVSRAFRSILWGICALLQEYRSGRVYGGSG